MILAVLEACRVCRFAMVICNTLSQSWDFPMGFGDPTAIFQSDPTPQHVGILEI